MNDADDPFIPLLAPKRLDQFTPEEFKSYVGSLYHKRERKKAAKKKLAPFTFRVNKKGTLCLRINRNPKWISPAEIEAISKETGIPVNDITTKLMKSKVVIELGSEDGNTAETESEVGMANPEGTSESGEEPVLHEHEDPPGGDSEPDSGEGDVA